jgi:7-carboxy-7-deazaguanine synthase
VPLRVNEIFFSIQGESSYAGLPCVFVRLSGCNLRCTYCDTRYAYEQGDHMDVSEIIDRVSGYDCRLVEITGGEPLLQEETPALISGLLDRGFTVLLETNGSMDISGVDGRCIRILDVKCPSSGEAEKNDFGNLPLLTHEDEIKFVVGDRADYEYA